MNPCPSVRGIQDGRCGLLSLLAFVFTGIPAADQAECGGLCGEGAHRGECQGEDSAIAAAASAGWPFSFQVALNSRSSEASFTDTASLPPPACSQQPRKASPGRDGAHQAPFSTSDSAWPLCLLTSSCPAWCLWKIPSQVSWEPGASCCPPTLQWAQAIMSHWASFILAVALGRLGSINGLSVCL